MDKLSFIEELKAEVASLARGCMSFSLSGTFPDKMEVTSHFDFRRFQDKLIYVIKATALKHDQPVDVTYTVDPLIGERTVVFVFNNGLKPVVWRIPLFSILGKRNELG